ncbi:MAG TPA: TetR/AcrR family transcriptional regulator [Ramlibacter sp.]|nr:TetR/AcrR family transcriptional regulator [Ramlibacter sp.]
MAAHAHVKSIVEDKELVAKRRAQLVEAAIARFSELGYHSTTVKDIAVAAGVSPGLVYQYVPDKQDLLFLCLLHIAERIRSELGAAMEGVTDPLSRFKNAIEAYAKAIDTDRKALLLTYRETKSLRPEWIEHMKKTEMESVGLVSRCIDECVAAGYLAPGHTELLAYRIMFTAHAWGLKNWRLRAIVTFQQYIEYAIHACWTPLLTPAGKRHYEQLRGLQAAPSRAAAPARRRRQ